MDAGDGRFERVDMLVDGRNGPTTDDGKRTSAFPLWLLQGLQKLGGNFDLVGLGGYVCECTVEVEKEGAVFGRHVPRAIDEVSSFRHKYLYHDYCWNAVAIPTGPNQLASPG